MTKSESGVDREGSTARAETPASIPPYPARTLRCGFCGKSKDETRRFIAGPSVYICTECVALCAEIIAEAEADDAAHDQAEASTAGTKSRVYTELPNGIDAESCCLAFVFLIVHHDERRKEAVRDAVDERFSAKVRARCIEVAALHQEEIYLAGEQIALLGGRNGWPRPARELAVDPSRSTPPEVAPTGTSS